MASPYYTKQPVYLKEPSGRYQNILTNGIATDMDRQVNTIHQQLSTFHILLQSRLFRVETIKNML